jgi:ribosomal protein S25
MSIEDKSSDEHRGADIVLAVLNSVEQNHLLTQRSLASELGIALGLANSYLKRCIRKGLIKIASVPPHRYTYYLTPEGFVEKGRLTSQYLQASFSFFRAARQQCDAVLLDCARNSWTRVVLYGVSELAEVAILCARDQSIEVVGVVDPRGGSVAGMQALEQLGDMNGWDAVLVTMLQNPQAAYDRLSADVPAERILTPRLLNISRINLTTAPVLAEPASVTERSAT